MFFILSIVVGLVYSTTAELNPLKCQTERALDLSATSDPNETCLVKSEFRGLVFKGQVISFSDKRDLKEFLGDKAGYMGRHSQQNSVHS